MTQSDKIKSEYQGWNVSNDKTCFLVYSGYDQRSKGSCCFIKHKWNLSGYLPEQGQHPSPSATAKSWFSGDWLEEIRQALARGEEHPACERCWLDESNKKVSKRQHANRLFQNIKDSEGDLIHLSLFTGNKCNLACRTCGAHSSTGWIKEHQYINKQDKKIPYFAEGSARVKKYKDEIDVPLNKLEYIEVLGGEPFYETDHLDFLDRVCTEADPSKITLFYSTNGTKTIDPHIEKMFDKFKTIRINFSIDAIGKKFEYIRTLGVWDQVEETIAYWKTRPNVRLKNHATVSILNMMYLNELYEYFVERQGFPKFGHMGYTYAMKPPHYSFNVISNDKKIKNMDWILKSMSYGYHHTPSIQNYLKRAEYKEEDFKNFLYAIKYTRDFRKLDIQDYLPELCKVLEI